MIRENQAHTFKSMGSILGDTQEGGMQYLFMTMKFYLQHLSQPFSTLQSIALILDK